MDGHDQIPSTPSSRRINLNIGGKLFETTTQTLHSPGPDTLLSTLSTRPDPIFIDRDPDIFTPLLTLLRTTHLPSSPHFSTQTLIHESQFYNLVPLLKSSLSPPPLLGIDASLSQTLIPSSHPQVSTFTANNPDGSLLVGHGGLITLYDWSLSHVSSFRTHFDVVTSVGWVKDGVCVVGSVYGSGLHFYNVISGSCSRSMEWVDESDVRVHKASVHAVEMGGGYVFGAYECRHGENCVLVIDKEGCGVVGEIGRMKGGSSKNGVADKLRYVEGMGVLVGSGVTAGAFGCSGFVRVWDVRSGECVWETCEPGAGRSGRFGDSFADVDVDVEGLKVFKVCSKSGDLGVADMRKLGGDPWFYLKEKNPSMRSRGGSGGSFVMHCYRGQVFVGREGELEVWSRVAGNESEGDWDEEMYRRNYVDKVEDSERGVIKKIEGGGDRLFVTRENVEGIEVWQSSCSSSLVSVL